MWIYLQKTGQLYKNSHLDLAGTGYSGHGAGRNNPDMEHVKDEGPLPCGYYTIEDPRDTESHGPYVLPLVPMASNEMFDRSEFLIHGDSLTHPGEASHGCMIQGRTVRVRIGTSDDRRLGVFRDINRYLEVLESKKSVVEKKEEDV